MPGSSGRLLPTRGTNDLHKEGKVAPCHAAKQNPGSMGRPGSSGRNVGQVCATGAVIAQDSAIGRSPKKLATDITD